VANNGFRRRPRSAYRRSFFMNVYSGLPRARR
jgi:hypothetical protein